MEYLQLLFWATVGSVVSLAGGMLLLTSVKKREQIIRFALPFGAGALLAAALLGALPEALHGKDEPLPVLCWALGGFLAFFVLERLLGWFHHHHHDDIEGEDRIKGQTHANLVVIGDTLHNAIDGVAIGAAFLVNPSVGVATALAVAAHEVPQEIGDFGILLGKGMRPKRVVLVNLLSALATIVTALFTYWLGSAVSLDMSPLLALAAGFFIYVAASDIIPDIHERPRREGNLQALMLLAGVVVIAGVSGLIPHNHSHGTTDAHHHHHEHKESTHSDAETHHDHEDEHEHGHDHDHSE